MQVFILYFSLPIIYLMSHSENRRLLPFIPVFNSFKYAKHARKRPSLKVFLHFSRIDTYQTCKVIVSPCRFRCFLDRPEQILLFGFVRRSNVRCTVKCYTHASIAMSLCRWCQSVFQRSLQSAESTLKDFFCVQFHPSLSRHSLTSRSSAENDCLLSISWT